MLSHEKRPIQWLRRIIQAFFVAFIVFVGLRHQYGSGGSPIDAYCPLGGVESLYSLLTQGKMLAKTAYSNLILLGILLLITLLAGGFFCGWICPLGTIQDWIYAFRKKFVEKTIIIPQKLDHYLRYLKYGVLILILIMTIRGMELWFADYDPFKVLFHFTHCNNPTRSRSCCGFNECWTMANKNLDERHRRFNIKRGIDRKFELSTR